MNFLLPLFFLSLVSASSFSCPSSNSNSKCGDKPDIRIPYASVDIDNPAFRFLFDGDVLVPVDPASLNSKQRKCARELGEIVFTPPNAARDYLVRIIKELSIKIMATAQGVYTAQTIGVIRAFSASYGVDIEIQPPFSNGPNFLIRPNEAPALTARKFGHLIAPTYLNQIGFQHDNEGRKTYSVAMYIPNLTLGVGNTLIITISSNSSVFLNCDFKF